MSEQCTPPEVEVGTPHVESIVFDAQMNEGMKHQRSWTAYMMLLMESKNDLRWQYQTAAGLLERQVNRIHKQLNEDIPIPQDQS